MSSGERPDPGQEQADQHGDGTIDWGSSSDHQSGHERTLDRRGDSSRPDGSSTADLEVPCEFGRYRLTRELGKGGMGTVYLGHDSQLDRPVAIKVPHFSHDDGPDVVDRFYREARAMATLHHPNLCPVFDVGDIDGMHYLTMAYIEGHPLSDRLAAHQPVPGPQAADIVRKLALALFEAHQSGIVHRDLKPGNIMIDKRQEPIIMDFGLARRDREGEANITKAGSFLGTPAYMSPEQIEGATNLGPPADIYSLGVILYQLLTGHVPFQGSVGSIIGQVMSEMPKAPTELRGDIEPTLASICMRAMAKSPADRQATANELASELQGFLGGVTVKQDLGDWEADQVVEATPSRRDSTNRLSSISKSRAAERRQVTVLYCNCDVLATDDDDFEEVDPEERHELVNQYKSACERVIAPLEGTVIPTAGDEVLVCFGYPVSYEDAAQRAARAGLAILSEITALNGKLRGKKQAEISAWVTAHTGLVVVGDMEDSTLAEPISIVGEARNVATRLENAADPGMFVVSEATHRLVSSYFECESLGRQRIKGMAKPVEAFQVTRASDVQSRIEAEAAALTPLIGRDREVALLHERWEEAQEGMGQVVLLVGEAGLGKSRLAHVLKEHVTESGEEHAIVEWRCSSYHDSSGFYAAIDYFLRTLELGSAESADAKLERLANYLDNYNLGDPNEVVPLFAGLLSIPVGDAYPPLEITPQRQKERVLEILVDWLREQAADRPILFTVEDLHWVDPSTAEFLSLVVDQCQNDPVLTVFTFRPEYEPPWGTRSHQTQVGLNRLRKKQIVEMMQVKTGVKELPPEVVDQIVDRTGGVPLFVEEFSKMVQESGGIEEVDGEMTITKSFSLDAIPATLQDLLMSRLDRLDADRELMQLGATLGREFSYELIEAVSPLDATSLQQELGKLVDAEVLMSRGRPPRATYSFKHALIRDAAYNSLLKKTRQEFHRGIASTLETQFPEQAATEPELLAHHYTEATEAGPAINYWLKAGQRSQQRSTNDEAIEQLNNGLKLIEQLDESPERDQQELGLLVPLGVVYMATLGWASEEVGKTFRRARELCETLGVKDHQFNVMWGMWAWHLLRAEFDTCMELAAETTELAESLQHPAILMEAPWIPACTQFYRAEFKASLENLELGSSRWDEEMSKVTALATGQNCGVTYLLYQGLCRWYLGYPDDALQRMNAALDLAIQLKHPFSHAFALWHISWLHVLRRDAKMAEQTATEALELATAQSFLLWKFLAMINRGFALHLQGQHEPGLELMEGGRGATLDVLGSKLNVPHSHHMLAQAKRQLGKIDESLEHLDIEQQHAESSNECFTLAEVFRLRGEMLLVKSPDNRPQAIDCFRRAIEVAQSQEAKSWELRAATSLARLLHADGNSEEARATLTPVFEWFTEGLETADLVDAKQLLDDLD